MRPTILKRAVFESGIRQKDVALAVGVSQGSLSRYLSGRREVPDVVIARILAAIDVPLSDFFDGAFEPGGLHCGSVRFLPAAGAIAVHRAAGGSGTGGRVFGRDQRGPGEERAS